MAAPLGIVVSKNPIEKAVDVYALILGTAVVNTIMASYSDILAINKSYDYCVDITMMGDPSACVGCTYNAGLNSFLHPPSPPIDYVENVHQEFNSVIALLDQMLMDSAADAGNLSAQQISAAYNSALNDNQGLNNKTLALIESVHQYVISGG